MKKTVLALLLILGAAITASAVPAWPGKYQYRQPDGSIIVLQNHGDEDFHWTTDEAGRVVEMDESGFYRVVFGGEAAVREGIRRTRGMGRRGRWSSYDNPPATNFGDRKVLCILAAFDDVDFSIATTAEGVRTMFFNMLNQSGYSYDGAIGSVRDYYIDNSLNEYRPQFDVYGPVTLSHTSAYYDGAGGSVPMAIKEAYALLASQINIADYDTDNDGDVDMVLFYYPGYNEAEGAPESTIWPHQGSGNYGTIEDKNLVRYFCTSELRGTAENPGGMCAIGTTCHEFAHSLGLPDFYDTDYAESGNGKTARSTGNVDLMASGNYNDGGRRPPYLSALERNMLGWMPAPAVIDATNDYVLKPVRQNAAYISLSKTEGEYFIYEYRDGNKWDSGIMFGASYEDPNLVTRTGMIFYRVDKSNRIVDGSGRTAADLWENTNKINAYGGHPCYRIEKPFAAATWWHELFLPARDGTENSITPVTWAGETTGLEITGIAIGDGQVTFHASLPDTRWLRGTVSDKSTGKAVEGATVTLSLSQYTLHSAHSLTGDVSATTDASGKYEIAFVYSESQNRILTVRKDGYSPESATLAATSRYLFRDVALTASAATPSFSDLGIAQTKVDGNVISAVSAADKVVESVAWYVDGALVGPDAPALSSGTHTYKVVFTYMDGSSERVFFDVTR